MSTMKMIPIRSHISGLGHSTRMPLGLTIMIKEKIPFVRIGNKADLIEAIGRMIDEEESKQFAESNGGIYIETSAKTGQNVEDAFRELACRMAESKGINIR